MTVELIVPTLGESITESTVSKWLKKIGEPFAVDEPLVEIETDKITVEVPAPSAGVLSEIKVQEGKDVSIGGVIGIMTDSNDTPPSQSKIEVKEKSAEKKKEKKTKDVAKQDLQADSKLSPSVKKLLEENNLTAEKISPTRKDGRLTKADILEYLQNPTTKNKQQQTNNKHRF